MSEEQKKTLGLVEFFAGCIGGFAQVMIGQPFDIVKVRLQTQKAGELVYTGALDCFNKIVKNEGGLLALWRGSLPPLVGVGAATSIQFGVNENTKPIMQNLTNKKELSFLSLAACGAVAGVANSVVSTPAEHMRIRIQSQGTNKKLYSGSVDCMRKIYREFGLRGVYKGGIPTVCRELIAYAIYFSVYEWCLRKISFGKKEPETLKIAMAGGFAGICYWLGVFPIDVVKTKIQTDSFTNPIYRNMMDCVTQTYKKQGFAGFWKGLTPCVLRAVPASSGTFLAYDIALGLLRKTSKAEKNTYIHK